MSSLTIYHVDRTEDRPWQTEVVVTTVDGRQFLSTDTDHRWFSFEHGRPMYGPGVLELDRAAGRGCLYDRERWQ